MNPDLRGVVLGLSFVSSVVTTAVVFALLGVFPGLVVAALTVIGMGGLGASTDPDPERTQRARNLRRKQ